MKSAAVDPGTQKSASAEKLSASDKTKVRLIVSAEKLISEKGLEAISLREIALDAGCRNKYAVQYHFKSKARLFEAISEHRMNQLEPIRAHMIQEARENGRLDDVETLIEIMCRPPMSVVSKDGRHYYASFMSKYLTRYRNTKFTHTFVANSEKYPNMGFVFERLMHSMEHVAPEFRHMRILSVYLMFMNVLIQLDNDATLRDTDKKDEYIHQVIRMSVGALLA